MKIPSSKRNFLLMLSLLSMGAVFHFSACLSEISLEVPEENSESIAIRGNLMAAEVPYIFVKITRVTDFRKFEIPEPVIGAIVILTDEANHSLVIPMQEKGEYQLDIPLGSADLEIKPGKSYQLSVITAEGKTYVSTLETLHEVPLPSAVDTIVLQREVINETGNLVTQEFIRFLLKTPLVNADRSGRSFLKWSFLGTFKFQETAISGFGVPNVKTCYFNDRLNQEKVVVFNGEESSKDSLHNFFLLEEPLDFRFYDGFYLSVYQQSLSEGAYQYWEQIGKVVDLSGTFFETPPGKIRSNFHNVENDAEEVFGYFYVTQEVVFRYYVPPLRQRVFRKCPATADDSQSVDYVCVNCLSRPGSTLVKPEFWME